MGADKPEGEDNAQHYLRDLRAPMETHVSASPRAAVHQVEWRKIMAGDPVEINPSFGHGMKVMTVEEWSRHWKRNDDLKSCLACGSLNTKEHHFIQTWCRGKKKFESDRCAWTAITFPGAATATRTSRRPRSTRSPSGRGSSARSRPPPRDGADRGLVPTLTLLLSRSPLKVERG